MVAVVIWVRHENQALGRAHGHHRLVIGDEERERLAAEAVGRVARERRARARAPDEDARAVVRVELGVESLRVESERVAVLAEVANVEAAAAWSEG